MDAKPKAVVLLGKVAAQYCKKAWPNATELYHPAFILRLGGQESTAYREFVRNLGEVFRRIA
jgi:uracil-DNA glycosylase